MVSPPTEPRRDIPAWAALTSIVLGLLAMVVAEFFPWPRFVSLLAAAIVITLALVMLFSLFLAATIASRRKKKR